MGNLGYQFVYQYLNRHPRYRAERFFYPDPGGPKGRGGVRGPLSEETSRPLSSFSVIAFSIPFENDYLSVPATLIAAGIPPLQHDRRASDPLVIAGGVSVSLNPEPLARFLDLAFIGELDEEGRGSGFFTALAAALSEPPHAIAHREEFLHAFKDVAGVYIPSAYDFAYHTGRLDPGDPAVTPAFRAPSRQ